VVIVCVYAVTLIAASLVSQLARRSILSTAVLFLVVGFLAGPGVLGIVDIRASDPAVSTMAQLALFAVLYSDAMRLPLSDLRAAWRLPGRALLLGMPITFAITALLAHVLAGQPWPASLLIGAALSPTDPVFAAAIVGREEVPYRLRNLLNVESGLNDGLALPAVVVFLALLGGREVHPWVLALEVVGGVALGIVVPLAAIWLARLPFFGATERYQTLGGIAIGLLVLSLADVVHANPYLAAFAAGVTLASVSPITRNAFRVAGDNITELLKLAALLLFGALVSPALLGATSIGSYVFAVLALVVARPVALAIALFGSHLERREWVAAAWFGPKGFSSVVYGLLVLGSGAPHASDVFHLLAVVIALSIVAHSSTDLVVARWFIEEEEQEVGEREARVNRS
jgi:NhaP-type Na+/H+ or K+/H+ antiporter